MDSWTVLSQSPENDAELEHYDVVTFEEAECVSPLPPWPSPSSPQTAEKQDSVIRPKTPELVQGLRALKRCSSAPEEAQELAGAIHEPKLPQDELEDAVQAWDAERARSSSLAPVAASVHGRLLPHETLQKRLTSAMLRGNELENAIEATKIAHHAINEKRHLEIKLAEALKKQNQLQHTLKREQSECRNAVFAAKELKQTNSTLNVMISNLQAHLFNQQDAERLSAQHTSLIVARQNNNPHERALVEWIGEIWLSAGHVDPQLAAAEKQWKERAPQAALNTLHPLLNIRKEGVAVENGLLPPLSKVGMLAKLLQATIQLAARQRETALLGIQSILHEARTAGCINIERRAQWLRGHVLLALDRPRDARACFGICASPELPDALLRATREQADHAITVLPDGHPGRELSEDMVQFYYQWTA